MSFCIAQQKNERGEWREILIDCDTNGELRYVISRNPTPASKVFVDVSINDF